MSGSNPVTVPEGDFDHHSHEMAYDPWPRWKRLREGPPLEYSNEYGGFYVASRYQEVCDIARNAAVFSSAINQTSIPTLVAPPRPPISYDPPDHHFYRMIINPFFSPAKVKEYEPWIRERVSNYVEKVLASDGFDVPKDLGTPLTRDIILRIMGVANAPENVNRWADDLIFGINPQVALSNLMGFLGDELDKRRVAPSEDLLTGLIHATHRDRALETDEQKSMALLVLLAGLDTTSFAISGSVLYLIENPIARKELASADDTTWRLAMDEFVRWVSPAPNIGRTASTDTDVGGCPMHAGDRVLMLVGSANRDEAEFPDPDTVVLNRFPNRHLGFGMGPHRCAGSHLAKLVMQLALKGLLEGLDNFALTDPDAVEWESASVRGIRSLPLTRI